MIDVAAARRRFPALSAAGPDGRPALHLDAPGGTQLLDAAIEAMASYLREGTANQHGAFATSERTDALCADVRGKVGAFLGSDPEGVVFGPNMTTLAFHLADALGEGLGEGDELVCTRLDHDANVTPWVAAAERAGASVRFVELDAATGTLDLSTLDSAVTERTRLIAFPGASNALGTLVDPAPFVEAARAVGALTFLDAVHAAPHVGLDRERMGVDVIACSPYKFFGPHAGLLAADPELLARLHPAKLRPAPDEGPERWQTGTASFEAIAGIGAAVQYLQKVGMEAIRDHERALSQRFLDGLDGLDHVRLHGPRDAAQRTPTFAVTVEGWKPEAVAETFAEQGIHVWSGLYYAVEPMRALGLLDAGGAVRIGFVHYHDEQDGDRALDALEQLANRQA